MVLTRDRLFKDVCIEKKMKQERSTACTAPDISLCLATCEFPNTVTADRMLRDRPVLETNMILAHIYICLFEDLQSLAVRRSFL